MIFGFEHGASRRYATLAERLIGSESADAPLPPGLILESDRPEWSFHKRETLWVCHFFFAAGGAGVLNDLAVVPTSAPFIMVVTGVITDQPSFVSTPINVAGFTNRGKAGGRDSRATTPATGVFTLQPAASQIVQLTSVFIPAGAYVSFPPIIVGVKTPTPLGVIVEGTVANVAQNISIFGYERPGTPDELSQ